MNVPYNKLTPAEAELLAMLAEEAGEIAEAAARCMIHGSEAENLQDPGLTNIEFLRAEFSDLFAIAEHMSNDIPVKKLSLADTTKWYFVRDNPEMFLPAVIQKCGLIVQVVMKTLRHGYASYNPFDANETPNRDRIGHEIYDLKCIQSYQDTKVSTDGVMARKLRYTHHQAREVAA